MNNEQAIEHFWALQRNADGTADAQFWDKRAQLWQREREHGRKGEERIEGALAFLAQRGLLQRGSSIADIGCGPGRFAAAFGKQVQSVVGLDISPAMVAQGLEHIRREGLNNVTLRVCDFNALNIEKEGYRDAFDLVFCSLSPALGNKAALDKAMQMSKAYCCCITHLAGQNSLRERIMREVFDQSPGPKWTGSRFYSLFNILFLMGYEPETSYSRIERQIMITADEEYAEFIMEHSLPREENTPENMRKILAWLTANQNMDGQLCESTVTTLGRILWSVKSCTPRSVSAEW